MNEKREVISPKSITSAPPEVVSTESEVVNPKSDPLTGQPASYSEQIGLIGKLVGGGAEKNGNIAVIVIVIFGLLIGIVLLTGKNPDTGDFSENTMNVALGLLSVVTTAFGFMMGDKKN